jgi:hypothetical protein
MDWKDQMEKNVRTFVPLGYVTAVLLLIVGVIMFVNPLGSMSALLWCLVAGLFLAGCFRIQVGGKIVMLTGYLGAGKTTHPQPHPSAPTTAGHSRRPSS